MRLLVPLLLLAAPAPAPAQDIHVRLSFKLIQDAQGQPTPGPWGDFVTIHERVAKTNEALERFGRGYRFLVSEVIQLGGASEFYDLNTGGEVDEHVLLEELAEADPAAYGWSTAAVNVYVPDTINGGTGGLCFVPMDSPDMEIVIVSGHAKDFDLLHEVGHHFDLRHTFENDKVEDTLYDPEAVCTSTMSCEVGGTSECCCPTKLAQLEAQGYSDEDEKNLLYNSMSYYGASDCEGLLAPPFHLDAILMTPGQMDRWADATRLYHPGEVTGYTYFVDSLVAPGGAGFSYDEFATLQTAISVVDPSGADVLLLRGGVYGAAGTWSRPVTLRSTGGTAVLGP